MRKPTQHMGHLSKASRGYLRQMILVRESDKNEEKNEFGNHKLTAWKHKIKGPLLNIKNLDILPVTISLKPNASKGSLTQERKESLHRSHREDHPSQHQIQLI